MNSFLWNDLALLPQRAAWRPATGALFVADIHIGKAAAFRAAGLAAPAGTTRENLVRLDALVERLAPRTLVVLGDLFHARDAFRDASLAELRAWRRRRARLNIILVAGNHDARAGAPPVDLGLEVVGEPFALDGLECRHQPAAADGAFAPPVLAGHVHPTARLSGPGHDGLRLPCFVLRGRQLILPAFGEFTGGVRAQADAQTALCVIAGERLVHMPATARGACGREDRVRQHFAAKS